MDLRGLPARENGSKESPGADERPRQGEVRSRREESGRRLLPGRVNPSGEARRAPPVTGSSNQGPHDPSRGEPRAIPAGERSRGPGVAFARSSRARAVTRPAEARGHPIRAQALRSRQNHSATRRKLPPTWRRGRPTPVPPLSQSLRPSVFRRDANWPAGRSRSLRAGRRGRGEPSSRRKARAERVPRKILRGLTPVLPSPLRSAEPSLPAIQETRTVSLLREAEFTRGRLHLAADQTGNPGPEDPSHSTGVTRPKISGPHGRVVRESAVTYVPPCGAPSSPSRPRAERPANSLGTSACNQDRVFSFPA